jgi:hypothetical protein
MSVKSNIAELKTTLTGIALVLAGVAYFALPYFYHRDLWEVNSWFFGVSVGVGIGLILVPDRIIDFIFGFLRKKTE